MTPVRTAGDARPAPRTQTHPALRTITVALLLFATAILIGPAIGSNSAAAATTPIRSAAAAAGCVAGQIPAAIPTESSGRAAVRTTIGVAKTMGVPVKGQIIAVMVMYQESTIRNLGNDGTSAQSTYWAFPGRAYWLAVTKRSLSYPHDRFGSLDGAHDTDSVGLYQQRPSSGWGSYGVSTGVTDPAAAVKRLLDPRWEAMAFFGGSRSAAPTPGLLDVANWQKMALTAAANAVQGSNNPTAYAKWAAPATKYVNDNQDAAAVALPWSAAGPAANACTTPLVVALRARVNNRYVSAESAGAAPLIASRTAIGTWEHFDLIGLGGSTIALRARINNGYASATNAGLAPLRCSRAAVGDWERFTLVSNSDGSMSLRALINYRLDSADKAGTRPLIANRMAVGLWEKFDLVGA